MMQKRRGGEESISQVGVSEASGPSHNSHSTDEGTEAGEASGLQSGALPYIYLRPDGREWGRD
jgi:hypothetical protein